MVMKKITWFIKRNEYSSTVPTEEGWDYKKSPFTTKIIVLINFHFSLHFHAIGTIKKLQ